jgi:CRP-like cAMP-binding protein
LKQNLIFCGFLNVRFLGLTTFVWPSQSHIIMENHKIKGVDADIFQSIVPTTLEKLDKIREIKHYLKGDSIFYQGKSPGGFYAVHSGSVKFVRNGKDGNHRILGIAKPGDFIGWEQLIENHYTKEAVAIEDLVVSCFPSAAFLQIVKDDSALSLELTRYLCKGKINLERKFFQDSLQQRLAANLLLLIEKFGINYDDNILLRIPLTKIEIAGLIGTNPETLIKLLAKFKKAGIIDYVGKQLLILNPNQLRQMSNY